jgi:hypothetical protein
MDLLTDARLLNRKCKSAMSNSRVSAGELERAADLVMIRATAAERPAFEWEPGSKWPRAAVRTAQMITQSDRQTHSLCGKQSKSTVSRGAAAKTGSNSGTVLITFRTMC